MTSESYLRLVELELRDLPWRMRQELISELRGHLSELPADTDLEARLGTPAKYAADLRAAAGLERRRGAIAWVRARRPRNVILTLVALTAVALTIGGVGFVQTYQPLAFGAAAPRDARPSVGFDRGRRFRIGVDVQNNGRFTVRVLGVPQSSGPFSGLPVAARVMMSRDTGGISKREPSCPRPSACGGVLVLPRGPYEPFHPFDLEPGEVRSLLLDGVYGHCLAEASNLAGIHLRDFPVRFSFLWKTATARIALPKEREIIPPNIGCRAATARVAAFHLLIAGQRHVFEAGTIKIGARIVCARSGVRAGALVPKRGRAVVGFADGRSGSATIRLATRPDGSVVARCGQR
jgi:hypothetical protein